MGEVPAGTGAILNAGGGAWAFEEFARHLSRVLGLRVTDTPAHWNYLLGWDGPWPPEHGASFIPSESILLASDKRLLARIFMEHRVPAPRTFLLERWSEVRRVIRLEGETRWVLKWPTGCGGAGHRLLEPEEPEPAGWPGPYVLQEFICLEAPEVYRLYSAGGETFGWNARRVPPGAAPSPWVAHARGARYERAGPVPPEAEHAARHALASTGLLDSFGCTDLIRSADGKWRVLEVGTDGVFGYVDRDLGLPELQDEMDFRLASAVRRWKDRQPGTHPSHGRG